MRPRVADVQRTPGPGIQDRLNRTSQSYGRTPPPSPVVFPGGGNPYDPRAFQAANRPPIQTPLPGTPRVSPSRQRAFGPAEGWFAMVLLGIALYCVVGSVIAAEWVPHSQMLLWTPIIGILVGFLIAKIPRFPQSILHLAACLIGHWLAIWLTSVLAFHLPWMLVLENLRLALSGQMGTMDANTSQTIFFFYLAFLCFFLGYFGSWLIYRARLPWLVALVYCSIILVNLNYVKQPDTTLPLVVIMIGALLLLIARLHLASQVANWRLDGLYTDRHWMRTITWRCMQIACVITLASLLFSWAFPVFAQPDSGRNFWDRTAQSWNDLISGHFSLNDLANLSPFSSGNQNFFDDRMTITGSVTLPQGEVLTYRSVDGTTADQPHYLVGFTYNRFDGHTWTSGATSTNLFAPGQNLLPGRAFNGQVVVRMVNPPQSRKNYIFGPEQPASFSVPVITYSDAVTATWTSTHALNAGDSYTAFFSAPFFSANRLALPLPQNKPIIWNSDWRYTLLKTEYLTVPHGLSANVTQTLKSWTQNSQNAYDALKSIEKHLSSSSEFSYSLDNPPIPANTNVVDWLLKNKQGFCTHYATTMAIMGRMLGIPTRVANGFSQGQYDEQRDAWIVKGSDAHSWVQAYFVDYGWVSFDPTPGFSPNAAPTAQSVASPQPSPTVPAATPTPVPTGQAVPTPTTQPIQPGQSNVQIEHGNDGNLLLWMGIAVLTILFSLAFCLFSIGRYWWSRLYSNSTFVASLYWRFCKLTSIGGIPPQSWQTPYEYSQGLSQRFPSQSRALWHLTELFVRDRWGAPQHLPQQREIADAEHHWRSLRGLFWPLLFQRVRRKS